MSPRRRPKGLPRLALTKTVVETGEGEFRFTLKLTNEGDHPAVNVATIDVWEQGLEVTAIGPVDGGQPRDIGDFGLEFILREFEAGSSVRAVYKARCRQSGERENVAVVSSANSEPAEASVTVVCP